ncbi:Yos1-like protein [Flagelloscypha sp. PMI_526]|nr:Yos1-like protein [Flagelloscypha sp. PMI_526]
MALGMYDFIGSAIYIAVLLVNSLAVLNEERFLARIGWSTAQSAPNPSASFNQSYDQSGYGTYQAPAEPGIKQRLIELVAAVRTVMRIPLIAINIVIIAYAIVLG